MLLSVFLLTERSRIIELCKGSLAKEVRTQIVFVLFILEYFQVWLPHSLEAMVVIDVSENCAEIQHYTRIVLLQLGYSVLYLRLFHELKNPGSILSLLLPYFLIGTERKLLLY